MCQVRKEYENTNKMRDLNPEVKLKQAVLVGLHLLIFCQPMSYQYVISTN
jgi:hypothetical protein